MEELSFTIPFGNAGEIKCDVLAMVNDEQENRTYLIYTDYTLKNDNEYNVYVSQLVGEGEDYRLEEVDDYTIVPELHQAYMKIIEELKLKVDE